MALYNDRAYAYERMKAIDDKLDDDLTLLPSFCDDDERNTLAFIELSHYEKTRTFIGAHPLVEQRNERERLEQLLISNTSQFMIEIVNAENNIRRYNSHIKKEKYKNEDERANWLEIVKRESDKLSLMQSIIKKDSK